MKVIVTGGAGFIGSNFLYYVLKKHPENEYVCLDKLTYAGNLSNLEEALKNPKLRFIKGDIADRDFIYKLFEEKLSRKEYSSVLNSVRKTVIDSKSVFTHLDLYDQCIIIIQLLKLFKCNRESSNLEKLNGKKQVGVIHLSQKLPINGEFILIHQSVTGLFEKEVDLLK